ncbi:MAG TPA: hypothetical protein VKU82_04270 [Planctomycetaceae bacterium]|nr:hypothetical protein [Planctomycetaceae bacterium]
MNLADSLIEVHARPEGVKGQYGGRSAFGPGQKIALIIGRHNLNIDVADLLT